jgi:hypothetical protein
MASTITDLEIDLDNEKKLTTNFSQENKKLKS